MSSAKTSIAGISEHNSDAIAGATPAKRCADLPPEHPFPTGILPIGIQPEHSSKTQTNMIRTSKTSTDLAAPASAGQQSSGQSTFQMGQSLSEDKKTATTPIVAALKASANDQVPDASENVRADDGIDNPEDDIVDRDRAEVSLPIGNPATPADTGGGCEPAGAVKDAADQLAEEHGDAYTMKKNGSATMNSFYMAGRYSLEHPIIFEPDENAFYQYGGSETGLWSLASTNKIKYQMGVDLKRAADQTGLRDILSSRSDGKLGSWVNTMRGMTEKNNAFKDRSSAIHLANGMLDLTGRKLLSFHRSYLSRSSCPIAFDPDAQCPQFKCELLECALVDSDIDLLQRWAGGVLLANNSAQRILFMTGTSGGGKSTFVEVIEKIIGQENVAQIRTEHLGKQFEHQRFLGKTLLTGKDVQKEFMNSQDISGVKSLVGNDLLDAEKKYSNGKFQMSGNFNVVVTCNSKLRVRLEGDADAWHRRLMIINYEKPKPKERISDYGGKLIKMEGPGILNWLIEGAIQYQTEIDEMGDLYLTPAQRSRVDRLLLESDSVRHFILARVVRSNTSNVTVTELQEGYQEYCEDMGWLPVKPHEVSGSLRELMTELHRVGFSHDIKRHNNIERGYRNLELKGGLGDE